MWRPTTHLQASLTTSNDQVIMEVREIRLTLIFSLLSVAFGFVHHRHHSLPRGWRNDAYSRPHTMSSGLLMAIKSTDIEKGESEDDSLTGVSRFAVMGGMFRGSNKDEEEKDTKEEDEAGFFKNVSKRLTFRRETDTVNGFEVGGDKQQQKKSSGILRMMGIAGRESDQTKDAAKQLALLQKEKELNRKRQLIIAEQKKRDEQKEKEIKLEEKRIAKQIAKAEAEQRREEERKQKEQAKLEVARQREEAKRQKEQAKLEAAKQEEEERKQKEEAKLEAERKREEARKQKEELKKQKAVAAAAAEKDESKGKAPSSAAGKFFSNFWNSTSSAFSRGEAEWVPLIPKTRIEPGEIVPVQVQGIDLLVVASRDGKVHCLANACSHMGTPLDTGRLESRPKQDASGQKILSNASPPKVECEDCILCPLHHTAFSLESGEVRGEWCPYPPVLGPTMGKVKKTSPVATFDIRTKGKNIEVRINSPVE